MCETIQYLAYPLLAYKYGSTTELTMMLRNIGAIKAHTMPFSGGSQQLREQIEVVNT